MSITLDQLVYDAADGGAEVGSHVLAGDDGTAIGHVGSALKTEDTTAIAILTTIDTDTGTISTNSTTIAGAIAGTEMQVDLVDAVGNWATGAGATDAFTQRVQLSTESLAALENITVVVGAADGANKTSVVTAGVAAVEVAATPLADRASIIIQNLGNKDLFIGESSGVTTANGIKVPRGGSFEDANAGPSLNYFVISSAATQDVRVLEKSAV